MGVSVGIGVGEATARAVWVIKVSAVWTAAVSNGPGSLVVAIKVGDGVGVSGDPQPAASKARLSSTIPNLHTVFKATPLFLDYRSMRAELQIAQSSM
jgi:hypothetical protein